MVRRVQLVHFRDTHWPLGFLGKHIFVGALLPLDENFLHRVFDPVPGVLLQLRSQQEYATLWFFQYVTQLARTSLDSRSSYSSHSPHRDALPKHPEHHLQEETNVCRASSSEESHLIVH